MKLKANNYKMFCVEISTLNGIQVKQTSFKKFLRGIICLFYVFSAQFNIYLQLWFIIDDVLSLFVWKWKMYCLPIKMLHWSFKERASIFLWFHSRSHPKTVQQPCLNIELRYAPDKKFIALGKIQITWIKNLYHSEEISR